MVAAQFLPAGLEGVMRVTIEHREETAGATGSKRNYFVDCTVQFSEEERAIIQARGLYDHHIVVDSALPPRSGAHFVGAGFLRGFAPITGIAGFVIMFFSEGLGAFLIFLAIGMFVAGFFMDRRDVGPGEPQQITMRRLLNNARFSIYAADPASAKVIDADLREKLSNLKSLLTGSAEISAKQTFEL
jgi:hypothetical protein